MQQVMLDMLMSRTDIEVSIDRKPVRFRYV
jgi:hypothetical protein